MRIHAAYLSSPILSATLHRSSMNERRPSHILHAGVSCAINENCFNSRSHFVSRILIAISIVLLTAAPAALISAPKKATPAELNLTDLDGKKVRLRDYRGKIVVLNFW